MPIEDGAQAACTPSCLRARTRRGCNTETSQGTRAPGSASSHRSRRRKVRRPRPQHPHYPPAGVLYEPPIRQVSYPYACVPESVRPACVCKRGSSFKNNVFLIALGSKIAAKELLAPSPFASAEWGLDQACGTTGRGTRRAQLCTSPRVHPPPPRHWPRPPPTVLGLLTPWVSLGRAAQS